MAYDIWTPAELYQVLTDDRLDEMPSYFLDTFFTETFFSEDKEILISKLPAKGRKLAPFVLPTEQGKPIFGVKGESMKRLTPPYIKPKDAVRPTEARTARPSELLRAGGPPSIEERWDARVIEIMEFHRRAIKMQEAWMAARAFIDGKVTVKYDRDQGSAYPEVTIDFGRDPGHTVVLSGTYWSDPNYDIIGDIQTWLDTMRKAAFGGAAAMLIVGSSVVPVFRKNKGIIDLLDVTYRGSEDVNMRRGLMRNEQPLKRLGSLGEGLEVYSYTDQVENNDGSMVEIFDPKSVLLVAPGATGVKAYGAIYDAEAMEAGSALQTDIFPKMWLTKDPGELYIMNQSSPLPIPLYPNRTFKATVLP